jgi:hypothetical protein
MIDISVVVQFGFVAPGFRACVKTRGFPLSRE